MTARLTAAQRRALLDCAEGGPKDRFHLVCHYRCVKQRLIDAGLLALERGGNCGYFLTDAGRAALGGGK